MKQLRSHWTDFREILYLSVFRKFVGKIQVPLKSNRNKGYFTWRPIYIFDYISLSSKMRNVSDKRCRETSNIHFIFNNLFLENCTFYKITWKNIVEWVRPQMTIWRMRIACSIPKATNTRTGCVIIIAFPQQHLLHERESVLRHTYITCHFKWKRIINTLAFSPSQQILLCSTLPSVERN